MRCLSVEDNLINQKIISAIINISGHEVSCVENGLECIKLLEHDSDFDLIFMDLMMPVMSGHEAIGHIRNEKRFDHIPIIIVTASPIDICVGCTLSQEFISKPFHKEDIISVLKKYENHKFINHERKCRKRDEKI